MGRKNGCVESLGQGSNPSCEILGKRFGRQKPVDQDWRVGFFHLKENRFKFMEAVRLGLCGLKSNNAPCRHTLKFCSSAAGIVKEIFWHRVECPSLIINAIVVPLDKLDQRYSVKAPRGHSSVK